MKNKKRGSNGHLKNNVFLDAVSFVSRTLALSEVDAIQTE